MSAGAGTASLLRLLLFPLPLRQVALSSSRGEQRASWGSTRTAGAAGEEPLEGWQRPGSRKLVKWQLWVDWRNVKIKEISIHHTRSPSRRGGCRRRPPAGRRSTLDRLRTLKGKICSKNESFDYRPLLPQPGLARRATQVCHHFPAGRPFAVARSKNRISVILLNLLRWEFPTDH